MNKYMEDQLEENRDDWLQHRINTLVTIGLVLAVALCLYVVVQVLSYGYANIGGFMMFRVVTGSMEPTIPVGSLLVTREVDIHAVEVGDIICFFIKFQKYCGSVLSLLFMVAGYTIFGCIIAGNVAAGLASAPGLLLKAAVNFVVYLVLTKALTSAGLKRLLASE